MQCGDFSPKLSLCTVSAHYNFGIQRTSREQNTPLNIIYLFIGLSPLLSWKLYQRQELYPLHLFYPHSLVWCLVYSQ